MSVFSQLGLGKQLVSGHSGPFTGGEGATGCSEDFLRYLESQVWKTANTFVIKINNKKKKTANTARGRGGAVDGGRGGVLSYGYGVQRRGAAAMLTKKPGASVLHTGEHSLCSRPGDTRVVATCGRVLADCPGPRASV